MKYKISSILKIFNLITIIAIITSIGISFSIHKKATAESTKQELTNTAVLLTPIITEKLGNSDIDDYINSITKNSELRITLIDQVGVVIADSSKDKELLSSHLNREEVTMAKISGKGDAVRFSESINTDMMYVALRFSHEGKIYYLRTSMPLKSIDLFANSFIKNFIFAGVIILISSLFLNLILTLRISRPLKAITETATAYSNGDFSQKIYFDNPKEFMILSQTLNNMAMNLEKKIRQIIRRKKEFESIFNSINDSILVFDKNLILLRCNKKAKRTFKLSKENYGKSSLIRIFDNTILLDTARKVLKEKEIQKITFEQTQQGQPKILQTHLSFFNYNKNDSILLVIDDISKIKKLETIRRDFVANVSHELKTPITSISGYLETLIDNPDADKETVRKFITTAHNNTLRLTEIINDILILAKLEEETLNKEDLKSTNIYDFLCNIKDEISEQLAKPGTISIDCDKELLWNISPNLIAHAVKNLIQNAFKYNENIPEVEIKTQIIENSLIIKVKDNGYGIAQEYKERIFERFFRLDSGRSRDKGGSGLGLAIVKHIIIAHKGTINLSSSPSGSTFTIKLPTAE
ncbi:MAG: HAMP domain-containing protein [Spirochaetales bacterium]|nr:HAMP domain-containing protein [Spirochaetales bacterium]